MEAYEELRRVAERARIDAAAALEAAHRRVEDVGTLVNGSGVAGGVQRRADDADGQWHPGEGEYAARRLDASTPRRLDASTPRRLDASTPGGRGA
jgi:hypothetical protein